MMELFFLSSLFIKHHIMDFEYQPPYQWKNKGIYGHFGGIVHSAQHVVATFIVIYMTLLMFNLNVSYWFFFTVLTLEFIIHYHMDWFKMWYGKKREMTPMVPVFWKWLGRDQLVHNLTYVSIFFYFLSSVN